MELILGISEETNFLESVFVSLPMSSLLIGWISSLLIHPALINAQTDLTTDFKRLRGLLGGSTGVLEI